MKNLTAGLIAASLCATAVFPVQAELSAGMDLSNLYLFRGINMSNGSPAIAGSLDYSHQSGLYAGVWSTSGDDAMGVEVDYYVGFAGEVSGLSYDLQYLNYYYPNSKGAAGSAAIVDFDDYAEGILSLAYKDASFSVALPTSDDAMGKYAYYSLSYGYQAFSATLGMNDHDDSASDYTHLDLSYQFNDNISFVLSQIVDQGSGSALNDATIWQVNYSLPISL